jgi:hypothetical protein
MGRCGGHFFTAALKGFPTLHVASPSSESGGGASPGRSAEGRGARAPPARGEPRGRGLPGPAPPPLGDFARRLGEEAPPAAASAAKSPAEPLGDPLSGESSASADRSLVEFREEEAPSGGLRASAASSPAEPRFPVSGEVRGFGERGNLLPGDADAERRGEALPAPLLRLGEPSPPREGSNRGFDV